MLPSRPPSANPAMPPIRPPKRLGCGDAGDGWLSERDGDDGVVGDAGEGDGLAGAEYERDPRLPPPDTLAHASPTWAARISAKTTGAIVTSSERLMAALPITIV